jgi:hypothetical protein
MVKFTERDIAIVAGLAGAADFLTEGRFSAPVARALKKVFRRAAPPAARTIPRLAGTAVSVGRQIALRHPVLTAGAVVYYTYKNRDEIGALVEQGYEIVQPAVEVVRERVDPILEEAARLTTTAYPEGPGIRYPVTGPRFGAPRLPRKKSVFNRAVSAGMKAVKKSTSYGGKGKIKPATKVFSMVTKLASAKKKKKKAPKSGIRRTIWNAMKGLR